jgi:hypothetical protein
MADARQFAVINIDCVAWPERLEMPLPRFRLFLAADTTNVSADDISSFAEAALSKGMVYFCSWGPGCERFHDIVDHVRDRFDPSSQNDVVMTTSHSDESLEEALDFFAMCAVPSDGYAENSGYRIVMCIGLDWADTAQKFLRRVPFFI